MNDTNNYRRYMSDVTQWGKDVLAHLNKSNVHNVSLQERIQNVISEVQENLNRDRIILKEEATQIHDQVLVLHREVANIPQSEYSRQSFNDRVPIGEHKLPPLPYDYNSLEPYISEEIMRLHHDKHHQSYVDGLNKAEKMLLKARESNDYSLILHWEREAAFHGSGHYLHTIFWNNMTPNSSGSPRGSLLKQLILDFGSLEQFVQNFTAAAKAVEGVGWAIVVWSPRSRRLAILQTEKHQLYTQWDTIPIMVLDVWEHAYYLQYHNDRGTYVDNWWKVVNWHDIDERFEHARTLRWDPY
ncbi:superoxide dismutase [Bacillus sp. SM2101]|uniref:superoxide dismutase n=1 Tax=Bacillus sp. SM2101 TaxID=2805366 RepID=UPI00332FB382